MTDLIKRLRTTVPKDSGYAETANAAADEIERLRGLFEKVQDHCAGDAHPRWGRDPATGSSRGYLLDICNAALD